MRPLHRAILIAFHPSTEKNTGICAVPASNAPKIFGECLHENLRWTQKHTHSKQQNTSSRIRKCRIFGRNIFAMISLSSHSIFHISRAENATKSTFLFSCFLSTSRFILHWLLRSWAVKQIISNSQQLNIKSTHTLKPPHTHTHTFRALKCRWIMVNTKYSNLRWIFCRVSIIYFAVPTYSHTHTHTLRHSDTHTHTQTWVRERWWHR